jgi:hypothetical protein
MSSGPLHIPVPQPITFPVEVEVKFKCIAEDIEDFEYLTSTIKETSIAADAHIMFGEVNIKCIECNGVKL